MKFSPNPRRDYKPGGKKFSASGFTGNIRAKSGKTGVTNRTKQDSAARFSAAERARAPITPSRTSPKHPSPSKRKSF